MDQKDVEDNYSGHQQPAFGVLDPTEQNAAAAAAGGGSIEMVDYMLNTSPAPPPHLSFAEVMQFADFRPKLPTPPQPPQVSSDVVDVESCFFKFPSLPSPSPLPYDEMDGAEDQDFEEEEAHQFSDPNAAATAVAAAAVSSVQEMRGGGEQGKSSSGRRKRGRSMKTSEEVESQRMTHIAVERNRRRQMNEHLRVLRALMPSSYVQRGDQASIIGGAIEFVRELEQLLQCLESQKRRRLYGSGAVDASLPLPMPSPPPPPPLPPFFPQLPLVGLDASDGGVGLREEMAENKSSLADIEVRVLGLDAMIKILSRRRPGQLLKTIAALEDMQLSILHTNITTIEQTVLYSFNLKITAETSCTAQEIANSVQHILGFIDGIREQY